MFTGIIQALGETRNIRQESGECRFYFVPTPAFVNLQDGESIAINGVCLSVENHDANGFHVYASAETMSKTNLVFLRPGVLVNLERALEMGERLGGHLVSGHVDCLATIERITKTGQSLFCRLRFPSEFGLQIIKKGSIALDGISLTINSCGSDFLEVNIIPDSQQRTNIFSWQPGVKINMETDLIGKYVVNYLSAKQNSEKDAIDREFLLSNGFI